MKKQTKIPQTLVAVVVVLLWGMIRSGGSSTTASAGPPPTPTPVPSPTPIATPTPAAESCSELATNVPPPPRFAPAGLLDTVNNRLTVFAGRNASDTANLNDVWVLTNANGTAGAGIWTSLIAEGAVGSPPARWGAASAYDSANNRLMIFGGCSGGCLPALNDVLGTN